jgi:hypothetical protein
MPFCRDIGPNPSARFQSLSAAYAGLHVRPGGGDVGIEPPTTFVAAVSPSDPTVLPDWARYQQGRTFNISILNDPDVRRCVMSAFGYTDNPSASPASLSSLHQDLRGTLAMIDYFRTQGNAADPSDPNDHGDPNAITQYEIERFVFQSTAQGPGDRWARMRDQGDGTYRRLHAILGLAQFLTTAPSDSPQSIPAPEAVNSSVSWWDTPGALGFSHGEWVSAGAITVVAVLATFGFGRWLGRRPGEARAEEARIKTEESIQLREAAETRIRELTEQLESARSEMAASPGIPPAEIQSLRDNFNAKTQELHTAQTELDRLTEDVAGRKRPSSSLLRRQHEARVRVMALRAELEILESQLNTQNAISRAHGFLGSH